MKPVFNRKSKLKFKTTEQKNRKKSMSILLVFATLVIITGAVSLTFLLKEYDYNLSSIFNDNDATTSVTKTTIPNEIEENFNVLFACTSTDEDEVFFISLISADTKKNKFSVTNYPTSGFDPKDIRTKAETLSDKKIDRYVILTEKNFKTFISLLGNFTLELNSPISYNEDDFSLNISKGNQTITGDKLIKYIRYTSIPKTNSSYKNQAQIICDLISQSLSIKNTSKGEELFNNLINTCSSDISIVDYTKYEPFLLSCAKDGFTAESK